jgi:hypothetical protein
MLRLQLILGVLLSLVLASSALAQSNEGSGNANGGSGSGNANSGSGSVPTPPASKPKPAPTRAPAPAATRAPVVTVRPAPAPRVVVPRAIAKPKATPKLQPKTKKAKHKAAAKPKQSAGASTCLSEREKSVLIRRADGGSIASVAHQLDLSQGQVRAIQQRGANHLLSEKASCARDQHDPRLKEVVRQVSQPIDARIKPPPVGHVKGPSDDVDLLVPNKGGPSALMLILLGVAGLLIVVAYQVRKQWGLSPERSAKRYFRGT